jgi:sarcosine oxidase subunit alpha
MMSKDKDFVGKDLAGRPALVEPARPILVGVKPVDPVQRLTAGSHFVPVGAEARVEHDDGHLTSVAWSPSLGHDVGIGFLAGGRDRIGGRVRAIDLLRGHDVECDVVSPVFIDPEGTRQHG